MKTRRLNIFRRITALIFILITALSLLFMGLTYLATTHFYQAGTQLLNKDVAAHIAKFTSPFGREGIDRKKADSVFYNAMVISPSAEVYFLDTSGKVIAFHSPANEIRIWNLPLKNIKEHIASQGKDYIKGPDPKDAANPKIFSAAEVSGEYGKLGYIYVILGSNEYKNVTEMLYGSHVSSLAIQAFCIIIGLSILISLLYINRLQRNYGRMITVLDKFQQGDFSARFDLEKHNELAPVTQSFNKMADLLVYNIDMLKKSEKDRKDFIANISHDLRTPLSIARGYTETLLIKKGKHEISQQEHEEYMMLVLNKIQQVENMVNQLFELSKMESVEFEAHKQPFIFSEIVLEIVNTSKLTALQNEVEIHCEGCEENAWINADIAMMERAIQNLLINAIKYTPKSGKINIKLERRGNELIFEIENNGEPLPGQLLNWINSSILENNLNLKRPVKSGLGLAIVRKIMHLHGYPFQAKTHSGAGNLFFFIMPVYTSHQ